MKHIEADRWVDKLWGKGIMHGEKRHIELEECSKRCILVGCFYDDVSGAVRTHDLVTTARYAYMKVAHTHVDCAPPCQHKHAGYSHKGSDRHMMVAYT